MRNFIQPGNTLTIPAPAGGVVSGGIVAVGAIVGVAAATAAEGDDVAVSVAGVFDLPKVAADAVTIGARLYHDASANALTVTAGSNARVAIATAPAGAGATTVQALLTPGTA